MVATFSTTSDRNSVSSACILRRGRRAVPAVKSARNQGSEGQEKTVRAAAELAETSGSKAAAHARAALNKATGLLKSAKTTEPAAGKSQVERTRSRGGQLHKGGIAKGLGLTQDRTTDPSEADLEKYFSGSPLRGSK